MGDACGRRKKYFDISHFNRDGNGRNVSKEISFECKNFHNYKFYLCVELEELKKKRVVGNGKGSVHMTLFFDVIIQSPQ